MIYQEFLYVLPYHPMAKNEEDFQFISVKKVPPYIQAGDKIYLVYRNYKNQPGGIIGSCFVAETPVRIRDIAKDKRHLCFNRSYWQIPVKGIECGLRNIIDEEVLYALPALNEWMRSRVYTTCTIIETIGLQKSLALRSKYWYVWRSNRSAKEVEEYNQLFIHELRDKYAAEHKKYTRLSKGITNCSKCGFYHEEYSPYTPPFFEFHEIVNYSLTEKYHRIDYSKFVALCPNCHRKAHELIVKQSFSDKTAGHDGFDEGSQFNGWNADAFKNRIE